jgi:hypothetical protein
MAYIRERPQAFLVCWRDAETGKEKLHSISWGNPYGEGTVGFAEFSGPLTREEARAAAEKYKAEVEQFEKRSRNALQRVTAQQERDPVRAKAVGTCNEVELRAGIPV